MDSLSMLPLIDHPSLSPPARGALNVITFFLSLILLERSADVFVDSTAIVAKRFGVSTVLVGLLTAGAEWEELAVVVSSMAQKHTDLAISNILGSCTANILGSFSLGLIFARSDTPLDISIHDRSSSRLYSGLLVVIGAFVALLGPGWGSLLSLFKGQSQKASAGRWAGIMLLIAFAVYVGGIVYGIQRGKVVAPEGSDSDSDNSDGETSESDDEDEPSEESADRRIVPTLVSSVSGDSGEQTPLLPRRARTTARPMPTYRHIIKLVISAALLTFSGVLLSSSTSSLADLMQIAQSTAGLTILSIGTTLPEKLVAFKSGRKAQPGVLIANTVGSNVFLLTLVLGVVWTTQKHMPLIDKNDWGLDVGIVLVSSVLLAVIIWSNTLNRWIGIVMFGGYVSYIITIFLR